MTTPPEPLPPPRARIGFRVLGTALLLGGLFFLIRGGVAFAGEIGADSFSDDPGFGPILSIAAGGFMIVFGLAALNAGFLGAQARYASGEVAPSVRELGSAFRGEPSGQAEDGTGSFCSSCGARGDREARFCDACGHELAPR